MSAIQEAATLTSKGQLILPKAIRQYLGVNAGSRVIFNLEDGQVTLPRSSKEPHADPAISSFLNLLEKDIAAGHNLSSFPTELLTAMESGLAEPVNLDEDIDGDVDL